MKRGLMGTILWTLLAACIGVGLFFLKHEVKDQERRLHALNDEIQHEQESIHVLRAEWSYLNDPTRLRTLAEKHLGMHSVKASEVATLDSVMRDGAMIATVLPPRQPTLTPQSTAHPPPAAKPQPVKLAESGSKPKSGDATRPQPGPKPQAPKPGTVTMAKAPPAIPAPAPLPSQTAVSTAAPARGGHLLTVRSPALAQSPQGAEDGR